MALSLSSGRATVQDPLTGCVLQEYTSMLHLLLTSQVRLNDLKLDEMGYG